VINVCYKREIDKKYKSSKNDKLRSPWDFIIFIKYSLLTSRKNTGQALSAKISYTMPKIIIVKRALKPIAVFLINGKIFSFFNHF